MPGFLKSAEDKLGMRQVLGKSLRVIATIVIYVK